MVGWDGAVLYTRQSPWVNRDESGKLLYYDGIIEDITDEKLALAEEVRAEAELKNILMIIPKLSSAMVYAPIAPEELYPG